MIRASIVALGLVTLGVPTTQTAAQAAVDMSGQASASDIAPGAAVTDFVHAPQGLVRFFLCGPNELTIDGCASGGTRIGADKYAQGSFLDLGPHATSDPASGDTTTTPGMYCWRAESLAVGVSFTNATTQCFFVEGGNPPQLVAAVLPTIRHVRVGEPASAYATVINAGATIAHGCFIAPFTSVPAIFLYQTTDAATNLPTGTPDTPVDIPPGAAQTFVIALTPTGPFDLKEVAFTFACADTNSARIVSPLNTLSVGASSQPTADIVAIAVTPTNDGIVNIPNGGTGVFALAVANIGASQPPPCPQNTCICGEDMGISYVNAYSGVPSLTIEICETNPGTGACLSTPVLDLYRSLAATETATFSAFVQSSEVVPFDPAANRIDIWFITHACDWTYWSRTGVAVRTVP